MNYEEDAMSSTDGPTAEEVGMAIASFFIENGIPSTAANSQSYIDMCHAIANYGRGLEGPTVEELETSQLDRAEKSTAKIVNEIKSTWKLTGVSLLVDGWTDDRNRSLINFVVNNQHGNVFLKRVNASDCVGNARKLFELIDGVVDEIGEDIVVQVITAGTSAYKEAGCLLMEKRKRLYWTPCVAHCIDLMLEKIGELPQHRNVLVEAKRVTNFIHNDQTVLSLTRRFAKKDVFQPGNTQSVTDFLTLHNMHQLKQPLQMMFNSDLWSGCELAKKDEAKAVKKIIMNDNAFWPGVVYSIKTTEPLVHVLRMVVWEKTPAMGFIYHAMNEAKEKIAKNLDGEVSSYKEIWDIIDQKWEKQFYHDLHGAAYFLNPRFTWSPNVMKHREIKLGLWNCMEKLLNDDELFIKVNSQIMDFANKNGMLGHRGALSSYLTLPPVNWWDSIGDEVRELKSFAKKVVGLTCSAWACERSWHPKMKMHLSKTKFNSLMFIMYNNKLQGKFLKKQSQKWEDDPLIVEDERSDDEWIANPNDEEDEPIKDEDEDEDEGRHSKIVEKKSSTGERKRKKCPRLQ